MKLLKVVFFCLFFINLYCADDANTKKSPPSLTDLAKKKFLLHGSLAQALKLPPDIGDPIVAHIAKPLLLKHCYPMVFKSIPALKYLPQLDVKKVFSSGDVIFFSLANNILRYSRKDDVKEFIQHKAVGINEERTQLLLYDEKIGNQNVRYLEYLVYHIQERTNTKTQLYHKSTNSRALFRDTLFPSDPELFYNSDNELFYTNKDSALGNYGIIVHAHPFLVHVPAMYPQALPILIQKDMNILFRIFLTKGSRISPQNQIGDSKNTNIYADVNQTGMLTVVDATHHEWFQLQLPLPEYMSDEQIAHAAQGLLESKEKAQKVILAEFNLAVPEKEVSR